MKKILLISIILTLLVGTNSCVDSFLEKPDTTGTTDLEKVFSTTRNAESALFYCYREVLKHGLPTGCGFNHGTIGSLSGELCRGSNWHSIFTINNVGLSPVGAQPSNERAGTAGADCMPQTWEYIRSSFLVKENIHKVTDMSETMKEYVVGEATALIAYRYMGMFYRFGGVPIIRGSFNSNDDLAIPRASLQDMLDYIIELCDEAYDKLPDSWVNIDGGKYIGRLTKGVALAMKARTLMFAARPLFNSATPYLPFPGNEDIICFGNVDPNRWQDAIAANEAVLAWAAANGYRLINTGGAGEGQPNPNAAHDYGTACSAPNNPEVILAYKRNDGPGANYVAHQYNTSPYWTQDRYDSHNRGILGNFLHNYHDKFGNDVNWPKVGELAERPISDYVNIIENIEPRFRIDLVVPSLGGWANPDDRRWQADGWERGLSNYETRAGATSSENFPDAAGQGPGCGASSKFYYLAGSRTWAEMPLFRMAEIYLNLAEAYNEAGNAASALKNLNMVHNRAGLPAIIETDKEKLRKMIWREKAVEFFQEIHRYFDVKHWKHPDIATNECGGQRYELQFLRVPGGENIIYYVSYWMANTYVSYWHPKMYLEPFHQTEVNKGIMVQNPGY